LKCGPPRPIKPPVKPRPPLASLSVEQVLSTQSGGFIIRAVIGRAETGHYLAIEKIRRGATEGDADQLISQHFVDLSPHAVGSAAFVRPYGFQGNHFALGIQSAPGHDQICQLRNLTGRPTLSCTIPRGGKLGPARR
jgi:hypothetical protein